MVETVNVGAAKTQFSRLLAHDLRGGRDSVPGAGAASYRARAP